MKYTFKDMYLLSEEEGEYLDSFTEAETGITDTIIWIGNSAYDGVRVKISNFNKINNSSVFSILLPQLEIRGIRNKETVTDEKLSVILEFLKINNKLIVDYSDFENSDIDTYEFTKQLCTAKTNLGKVPPQSSVSVKNENPISPSSFFNQLKKVNLKDRNSYHYGILTENERERMMPLNYLVTGIHSCIIWAGISETREALVKIGNYKGVGTRNVFSIMINDLSIAGNINYEYITEEKMNLILQFVKQNKQPLIDYSQKDNKIDSLEFYENLRKL